MKFNKSAWLIGGIIGLGLLTINDSVWAVNGWDNPDNYQDNWSQPSQPSRPSIGRNDGSYNGGWNTDLNGNSNNSYSGNSNSGNSYNEGYNNNSGNSGNNGGYAPSNSNPRANSSGNSNNSNPGNSNDNNNSGGHDDSNQSSASSSSSSDNHDRKESHAKSYSYGDLLKLAKARGNRVVKNVREGNRQRVVLNNQRGAIDLTNSYHQQVAIIKNKKITKAQKQAQLQGQTTVLQKVLNMRLASLQNGYNGEVKGLRNRINHLPNGHKYDSEAIGLQDKLAQADYQLGKQSNQAYSRYNKAVAQLNKAQTSQKTRDEQLKQAHQDYLDNLAGNQAIAPATLKRQNKKRLKEAKAFRRAIIQAAEMHEFNTPSDVKHFEMR